MDKLQFKAKYLLVLSCFVFFVMFLFIAFGISAFIFGIWFKYCGKFIPYIVTVLLAAGMFYIFLRFSGILERHKDAVSDSKETRTKYDKFIVIWIIILFAVSTVINMAGLYAVNELVKKEISKIKSKGYPVERSDLCRKSPAGINAAVEFKAFFEKNKNTQRISRLLNNDIYGHKWTKPEIKGIKKYFKNNNYFKASCDIISRSSYFGYFSCENPEEDELLSSMGRILEISNELCARIILSANEGNIQDVNKFKSLMERLIVIMSYEPFMFPQMITKSLISNYESAILAISEFYRSEDFYKRHEIIINNMTEKFNISKAIMYEHALMLDMFRKETGNNLNLMEIIRQYPLYFAGGFVVVLRSSEFLELIEKRNKYVVKDNVSAWPIVFYGSMEGYKSCYDTEVELKFLKDALLIKQKLNKCGSMKIDFTGAGLKKCGIEKSELIDPFSDKSDLLRIKDTQGGIIIYSIGRDRVDDGGDIRNRDLGFIIWK